MGIDIRMSGDHSDEIKAKTREAILTALDAAGMQAASLAKVELQNDPSRIDTGLLRNSITHAVSGEPAAIRGYHASGGSKRKSDGTRVSAGSRNAGEVKVGFYSGNANDDPDGKKAVYIGTNVEYAAYVHEGTDRMEANRFLKKALENNKSEYERIIAKVLRESMQ